MSYEQKPRMCDHKECPYFAKVVCAVCRNGLCLDHSVSGHKILSNNYLIPKTGSNQLDNIAIEMLENENAKILCFDCNFASKLQFPCIQKNKSVHGGLLFTTVLVIIGVILLIMGPCFIFKGCSGKGDGTNKCYKCTDDISITNKCYLDYCNTKCTYLNGTDATNCYKDCHDQKEWNNNSSMYGFILLIPGFLLLPSNLLVMVVSFYTQRKSKLDKIIYNQNVKKINEYEKVMKASNMKRNSKFKLVNQM